MMNEFTDEGALAEFDLQPDPRVLPMLGEINIDQWRCIAELIDNSIDGFLNASRVDKLISSPRIDVVLPVADKEGAQVKVTDNGIGMLPAVLERAVRAGWSGNNPIDNLGLFGMGFNIATARLGSITEVWTTCEGDAEWHGLSIDFDELRRQRHFRTAHLRRPKADPQTHGTEVTIKRLKPEQRRWLAKAGNQSSVRRRLAQAYSSMLRQAGIPISFDLFINNKRVEGWRHCVWNESRTVPAEGGVIHALTPINYPMADRLYCTHCMTWLFEGGVDEPCPVCSTENSIIKRARRVTGWIGIQRYLDQTDFGFDFIRNGRKIEIANKDLFTWRDGETEEREYPIDDQRGRGRIVGEIHIDHCRVSYAKDRFDRADPSWEEMIRLVRGEGPLRPEKAKALGYSGNTTPLFRMFRAFRRTSPHSKTAGAWARILVVKDNERATEMVNYFHEGRPEYQDDLKWWDLVEEADRELLYGTAKGKPEDEKSGGDGLPAGLVDEDKEETAGSDKKGVGPEPSATAPIRREVPSLSRKFLHPESGVSWNVVTFQIEPGDPEIPVGAPWAMPLVDVATRTYHFLYDPGHSIFSSITMTPRDALLTQLCWMTGDILRTSTYTPDLAQILAQLRKDYGDDALLDPRTLSTDAVEILIDLAKAFVASCPEEDRESLFNDLPVAEQQLVMRALAARKIKPTSVTADGSFLQYAPYEILRSLLERHPEFWFDGRIWDEPYQTLDYGDKEITDGARAGVVSRYLGLIADAMWLARQDNSDFAGSSREEIIRATMSLRLLRPDVESL